MTHPLAAFLQGLAGDEETPGFRGAYGLRQQLTERKRKLALEGEDRDYERARRLREGVAFELQQRYVQSQIDRNERTPIARNIDPNSPEAQEADYQDWKRRYDYERANPKPTDRAATTRQDLGSVERQVDDTRSDLARAERDMPVRPPLAAYDPKVAEQFTADSTAAAVGINLLRERADSLGGVRDSIAAVVQGRRPPPATRQAKRRITADQAEYLKATGQWNPDLYEVAP